MKKALKKCFSHFTNRLYTGNYLRTLCQKCIEARIDEWVWVLPVLHEFSAASNQDGPYKSASDKQEDEWAGLEGLAYNNVIQRER